jgi:ABC-type transporter Mla subunit MlaD
VRSSRESVWYFKESVEKLPRFTSRLNKAKKNISKALLELSTELEKTESMFAGVLDPIKRL